MVFILSDEEVLGGIEKQLLDGLTELAQGQAKVTDAYAQLIRFTSTKARNKAMDERLAAQRTTDE